MTVQRARSHHATSQNPQDSRINCVMIQDGKLRRFAMGQAILVRTDYTAGEVGRFAQRANDAAQARRLLAIAAVLDGASREEAAKIGGMDRQTLRDWVIRFNEQGADGLINIPSPGMPPKLNAIHKAFLARLVEEGPIAAIHGVVRWRACDLIMRLYEEFGLSVSDDTIYRALKTLGFSHMSARPKAYKQSAEAVDAFKKNFAERVEEIRAKLAPGTSVEVWFQDEMRVGQKNKLTYRWARKGSRPRAAHDQRTQSTYLFGAVCPERGAGAALVLPACNCEAMQLHLDEIATKVALRAHAIILLDQAGWHGAKALVVPNNISLVPLPPRAPELNGQENIWQFMRQNWLSNLDFQILRRYRRPLLLRLEHTHRPTLEDYVHRATRLGSSRSLNLRIGIRDRLGSCIWRHKTQIRSTIATFYSVQRSEIRSSSYGKSRSMDVTASMTPTTFISTVCRRRSGMNAVSAFRRVLVWRPSKTRSGIRSGMTLPRSALAPAATVPLV